MSALSIIARNKIIHHRKITKNKEIAPEISYNGCVCRVENTLRRDYGFMVVEKIRKILPHTLPVMAGYLSLGIAYGLLMERYLPGKETPAVSDSAAAAGLHERAGAVCVCVKLFLADMGGCTSSLYELPYEVVI